MTTTDDGDTKTATTTASQRLPCQTTMNDQQMTDEHDGRPMDKDPTPACTNNDEGPAHTNNDEGPAHTNGNEGPTHTNGNEGPACANGDEGQHA